ncbi:MAG: hypothetical protein WDM96_02005 [Lacunisphaera sp.]
MPVGARASVPPFVQLATAGSAMSDQVLREKAELLDPTPLFFPTALELRPAALAGGQPEATRPGFRQLRAQIDGGGAEHRNIFAPKVRPCRKNFRMS